MFFFCFYSVAVTGAQPVGIINDVETAPTRDDIGGVHHQLGGVRLAPRGVCLPPGRLRLLLPRLDRGRGPYVVHNLIQ